MNAPILLIIVIIGIILLIDMADTRKPTAYFSF